ncbi:MAG: zinc-ribbon domain-containing protein [Vitreoscilla sp.]|nr:zinc-ribbon domain-containing protein [Vitreoscilla sp.]
MIFIFGITPKQTASKIGEFTCPICQAASTYQWRSQRSYVSVFFLPLFPVGKERHILQCTQCHTVLPEKFLPTTDANPSRE